jgi:hypothetical protein
MKRRWVYDDQGNAYEIGQKPVTDPNAPMVMPDIQPYQSMADGSWITSRSQHREHLKAHGCIEIGNEVDHLMKPRQLDVDPQHRKELLVAQIQQMGHEGFKKALRRDIDFIKWNSRGLERG